MVESGSRVGRRQFLVASGSGLALVVSGCLGGGNDESEPPGEQAPPDPIDLSGGKVDDHGGMIIGEHAGPNGQIFYEEESPENHENPAWFHTLAKSLFPYHFERKRRGWTAVAIYVTDYSLVDYELAQRGGRTYISTHTGPETFERARDVRYVAGSDVLGGMGKDLVPFSNDDDLETFREEHGGDIIGFSDITPDALDEYT